VHLLRDFAAGKQFDDLERFIEIPPPVARFRSTTKRG
jgi:hypothetical protein